MTRDELRDLVLRFSEALSGNDLDAVMRFFAVDATYVTYDGDIHHGVRHIRAALEPQFRGDLGAMQFHVEDLILDETTGQASLRYLCTHQIGEPVLELGAGLLGHLASTLLGETKSEAEAAAATDVTQLKRMIYRGLYGGDFGWHGVDVLRVQHGLVAERRTYTRAKLPQAIKQPPLPTPTPSATRPQP